MIINKLNYPLSAVSPINRFCFTICWLAALLIAVNSPLSAQQVDNPEAAAVESEVSGEAVETEDADAAGAIPSEEEALRLAEAADSLWNVWMATDWGSRTYYFRRSFDIQYKPAGGKIWLTADDNWSLFINGSAIQYDTEDEIDWSEVTEIDVSKYLVIGKNTVTIQVDDVDDSRQGLLVGIEYSTIPDLESKLNVMEQEALAEQAKYREANLQREEAERALIESQQKPLTEEEMFEIRSIEKNKLD